MKSTFEYLEQEIYLPGFMTLTSADYDGLTMNFSFHPAEPDVTRFDLTYLTPRGLHITLSQAGICLVERIAEEEGLIDVRDLRDYTETGRLKITELHQRFRRETPLKDSLQGRMSIDRLRVGKTPLIRMSFDFENSSIKGELTGVIASGPVQQTNYDLLRN